MSEMAITKNSTTINAGEAAEKREPLHYISGDVNWHSHYGEQSGGFIKY